MKTKKHHFLRFSYRILLLWMLFYLPTYSQNSTPTVSENKTVSDNLAEQLQSLSKNNASDLVYLQTSKGIYETEEDFWFKGYVLDAQNFTPSVRNKILFVQLIQDKTDKAVWENKYEIENGFVNGHLFLQDTLQEGIYTLAAYSSASYMKNTKEFYAVKKLEILKTINHKPTINPVAKDSTLQFTTFPEGGNLVSGIQSTLGFKAVNSKGLPVNVSGTLYESDKPLLDFKSSHAGMGGFLFTPDANKKYYIQLKEPARKEQFPLAKIYQNGKVLQLVRNTKEELTFKVSQSVILNPETVYLRLQVRGVVYSIASGLLKKELLVKIPLKDVPQGIAEATLFDSSSKPVAEQLVYVNQDQKLNIKAELDKNNYNTRDKSNLKIKVTDQNGQPVIAHLGLSVYDKLYQNKQDSKNILTHYLLSTQLKGNIYDPAYYFDERNKDRQEALNLLLLTQGWRSYVWEESNLIELGNPLRPIVFDNLKAKIGLKNAGAITKEHQPQGIKLFAADEHKGTQILMADATGNFTVTPNDLKKGEGDYSYLKLLAPPESKYHITLKDFSFEEINNERKIKATLYPIPTILETKKEALPTFSDRPKTNKLKEVLITSKKKGSILRDKFIGELDSKSQLKPDYICPYGILNCPNHPPFQAYDSNKQLTEAQLLTYFNIVTIKGYYGKKVFYEPIYDEVTINDSSPDYRNTLFWKPDIITNEQGEATVDFFCSDINTMFLGNIEGVSGDGLLGAGNFEFSVRKNAN
ncbi:hypothetical protein [Flavobacterium gilvum]|nr:hypothetical protein [Flavobacterium gilvum]